MRATVAFVWLSVSALIPCAAGYCADAGPLIISVPEGYDGPIRSEQDGGVNLAWVKRRPGTEGGTLLQVSSIDMGTSLDGITLAQRAEGARHYLLEFVNGIGRSRGNFETGDIEQKTLAGLPAARLRWTGTLEGKASIGVMYCVLVGRVVVSLHTQDIGSSITPAMYGAMSAIEAVQLTPAARIGLTSTRW